MAYILCHMACDAVLDTTMAMLGLKQRVETPLDLAPMIRKGLPSGSFVAIAKRLEMSVQATAESIGLAKRTVARRVERKELLDPEESERLVRLARVLAEATAVLGSEEKARRWLSKPNRVLGAVAPLSLLDTDVGASAVFEELGRVEHGVFV